MLKVKTAELVMALATLLLSLAFMYKVLSEGLIIGWVDERGPGAGAWPFWLSVGMALASIATLVRCLLRMTPESRSNERYFERQTLALVVISATSILALLLLMRIVGTYVSLALFMLLYVRYLGRHSWPTTAALTVGAPIAVYLLFEVALVKYLPKGLPPFEEAFLVIDNLRYEWFD